MADIRNVDVQYSGIVIKFLKSIYRNKIDEEIIQMIFDAGVSEIMKQEDL